MTTTATTPKAPTVANLRSKIAALDRTEARLMKAASDTMADLLRVRKDKDARGMELTHALAKAKAATAEKKTATPKTVPKGKTNGHGTG